MRSASDADDRTRSLLDELARRGVADVDVRRATRAAVSTDSSLYRVVPLAVARPRHVDELPAVLEAARAAGVPVTARGAGTSVAGNAVGPGLVVDTARHLHRVLELDAEGGAARVEPGVVHAVLQRQARAAGLRLGPDPSTHPRCTVGGMVGNNACGSRALGYGRTADVVRGLRAVLGSGEVLDAVDGRASGATGVGADLVALAAGGDALAHVRTHHGRFTRQVSGYALEHLLPERGRRADRLLVGSEGTLGLVQEVSLALAAEPRWAHLVVVGFADAPAAADAVPALLAAADHVPADRRPPVDGPLAAGAARLVACEGLGARLVDLVRARRGPSGVPELPPGGAWLLLEVAGDDAAEVRLLADRLVAAAAGGSLGHRHVPDATEAGTLWRIREDGAGLAARSLARPAHAGWEDAAVPPERLGDWLRTFEDLLRDHGLDGVPYGHFGDGCVHVRIDFPLDAPDGPARFREFLDASARALASYGGSASGEHGDGRARSALLALTHPPASLDLFRAVKRRCDPDGLLNPGVLVDPAAPEEDLRPARPRRSPRTVLRLAPGDAPLAEAVHRCTGVGSCVAPVDRTGPGSGPPSVMCPSWQATRDEVDSTRGRARVLQEALDAGPGTLVRGLADDAVHEALDLCLACKGCARDCPTGVDVATWKTEALHARWRGRVRPRHHYALGGLPRWLRAVAPAGPLVARLAGNPAVQRVGARLAGVDPERSLPVPAARTLRRRERARADGGRGAPDAWLWADSFTDHLAPGQGAAALAWLRGQGVDVRVVPATACCGLTWTSTGRVREARREADRAVAALAPYAASAPLLGLEPSCTAALRDDLLRLSADPRAADVAGTVVTLAELVERLLAEGRVVLPDLRGLAVLAQPHCHHASVLGWDADRRLLERAGAVVTEVGGCCGLAGAWGMVPEHRDVSRAVAEVELLPALRAHRADHGEDAVVLADGLSCRRQLVDLAGVRAVHLADLLAGSLAR